MNDLDDLRRTLTSHAADVAPGDVGMRRSAVGYRIGVARRRRAAAGAGALAAIVLAVGVALVPGDDPRAEPVPASEVVGVPVPQRLTATGYTYEVADVVAGQDGRAEVTLPPSDETRLVSWATSGNDQQVTVDGDQGDQVLHLDDPDFDNWVMVYEGSEPSTVRVDSAVGQVGLAVYELGDEPPAGFREDGVTALASVTGGELVGAVVGDPGQTELTLPVESAGEMVWLHAECTGAPAGARLDVLRDGEVFTLDQECGDALPLDMSGLSESGSDTRPGQDITFEARLTDRSGDLVESGDARIALTVYSQYTRDDPQPTIEAAGHTWQLADVQDARGADPLVAQAPLGRGMVWVAVDVRGDLPADVSFGGRGARTALMSAGSGTGELVDAGQTVRVAVSSDAVDAPDGATSRRIAAFYVRAD